MKPLRFAHKYRMYYRMHKHLPASHREMHINHLEIVSMFMLFCNKHSIILGLYQYSNSYFRKLRF